MMKESLSQDGLVGDFFHEVGETSRRAVIMLGGSEGGSSWSRVRTPVRLLVERGFAVLSLAYFKAPGLPESLQEIPLDYFDAALEWLSGQPGIAHDGFAILGASKGAEAGLLLASRWPQARCVIAFSPSSVVWQGIPAKRFALGDDMRSSWSLNGHGLPFLPYAGPFKKLDLVTLRLRDLHAQALANIPAVSAARIPVERINGGVLLLSARNDRLWPAAEMGEAIMGYLDANHFEHPHKHLIFDGGHHTLVMKRDAWRMIFQFLESSFEGAG
jgi:hypothetical protein